MSCTDGNGRDPQDGSKIIQAEVDRLSKLGLLQYDVERGAAAQGLGDVNDGKPWSEVDLFDLPNSLAYGRSVEEVAGFLCRAGTVEEVRRKAEGLGLLRSK